VVVEVWKSLQAGMQSNILRYEQEVAAAAARDAIEPIKMVERNP
jgi:hypothetical protein